MSKCEGNKDYMKNDFISTTFFVYFRTDELPAVVLTRVFDLMTSSHLSVVVVHPSATNLQQQNGNK